MLSRGHLLPATVCAFGTGMLAVLIATYTASSDDSASEKTAINCAQRTWPYIDSTCVKNSADNVRRIRVVSTVGNAPAYITTTDAPAEHKQDTEIKSPSTGSPSSVVVNEQHRRKSTEGRGSDNIVLQTATSVMDEASVARGDANSAVVRMIKVGQIVEHEASLRQRNRGLWDRWQCVQDLGIQTPAERMR